MPNDSAYAELRSEADRHSHLTTPVELVPTHDVPLPGGLGVFTDAFEGDMGGSFAVDSAALARLICRFLMSRDL